MADLESMQKSNSAKVETRPKAHTVNVNNLRAKFEQTNLNQNTEPNHPVPKIISPHSKIVKSHSLPVGAKSDVRHKAISLNPPKIEGLIVDPKIQVPGFAIEVGQDKHSNQQPTETAPQLHIPEDIFAKEFSSKKLINFVGTTSTQEGEEHVILSVIEARSEGKYTALKTTKKGYEKIIIEESDLAKKSAIGPNKSLSKRLSSYLKNTYEDTKWAHIRNYKIVKDIMNIERKHPQDNHRCMKISVIYGKEGQKAPNDMFPNTEGSTYFWDFMNTLGEKIDLKDWQHYRGDMGKEGESYFTKWHGFQVMFHLSLMMNAEQHRRLIGNDIASIIFYDSPKPYDPSEVDKLGTVPQVFAVVQPDYQGRFRLGFMNRVNVKPYFGPELPSPDMWLSDDQLKDFLLTKLANGYIRALQSPPMNRLFYVPRQESISEIAKKYPEESKNEAKQREKQELQQRQEKRKSLSKVDLKPLTVKVIGGRNLASKDVNGFSDPYVIVSIETGSMTDQQAQTQIIKKTLNPTWNEQFSFDLSELDPIYTDVVITCMDWDMIGGHDFMGYASVNIKDIYSMLNQDIWLKMLPKGGEEVSGEILVQFNVPFAISVLK